MKRALSLLLCLIMLSSVLLTACNREDPPEDKDDKQENSQSSDVVPMDPSDTSDTVDTSDQNSDNHGQGNDQNDNFDENQDENLGGGGNGEDVENEENKPDELVSSVVLEDLIGTRYGSSVPKKTDGLDLSDVDENGYLNDRLPSGEALAALGIAGSEVKILTWGAEHHRTFPKEDSTNDPIQSMLYYHWRGIEERFGITLKATYTESGYPQKKQFLTDARAEDATYDLIQTQSLFPIYLAQEGRLCNLVNLGYPDRAMPWWSDSLDEWVQDGAMYFISSHSSMMSLSNLAVIFANNEMIGEKGLELPVDLTLSGRWTLDKMVKIAKTFAEDIPEASTGKYGFTVDHGSRLATLYYACGFSGTVKQADGSVAYGFDEDSEVKVIGTALMQFKDLFTHNDVIVHSSDSAQEMYENRTALHLGYLEFMEGFRGDNENYTVVPLPMLHKQQYAVQGYRSVHRDYVDSWCIPKTSANKTLAGMVLEANASSEYRNLAPIYCDWCLHDLYENDDQAEQMIAILRNSIIYDLGRASQEASIGVEGYWNASFDKTSDLPWVRLFYNESRYLRNLKAEKLENLLNDFDTYKDQ